VKTVLTGYNKAVQNQRHSKGPECGERSYTRIQRNIEKVYCKTVGCVKVKGCRTSWLIRHICIIEIHLYIHNYTTGHPFNHTTHPCIPKIELLKDWS